MPTADPLARLLRQLQGAYSGELAAAYAYRGHWKSVSSADDREQIRQIEADEWHHRELVGGLLREAGGRPSRLREAIFFTIGRTLGALCHVSGTFLPMYGAGKLERGNIVEYEEAAEYALACGREEMIDCLLTMAEVEWDHERYFRGRVVGHPLLRIARLWPPAPPRETIRARFAVRLGESRRVAAG